MGEEKRDEVIVLRTRPTDDEAELLAYLQALCERRAAAQADPLTRNDFLQAEPTAH